MPKKKAIAMESATIQTLGRKHLTNKIFPKSILLDDYDFEECNKLGMDTLHEAGTILYRYRFQLHTAPAYKCDVYWNGELPRYALFSNNG